MLAGLYFRFTGYYTWPLAVDEFYIYKAMMFVLESGLPQFPCGGYYTRGLLYQSVTVPLLYLEISPEAALRSVTIVSNILMFPAGYLLARKIGGTRIAAIVVIILALSTWEIEMARFGRMYAPFQMIFLWYVYHAYCLIVDGDASRWRWLFFLSIVGPLVWEGAIVLALFNFVPFLINRTHASYYRISGSLLVLAASVGFLTTDFRALGQGHDITSPVVTAEYSGLELLANRIETFIPFMFETPGSIFIFTVLLLAFVFLVGRAIVRKTINLQESLVISFSSIALLANQVLLAALILSTASLLGWVRAEILRIREIQLVALLMTVTIAYCLVQAATGDFAPTLTSRIRALLAFPDILYAVVYPWLFNMPVMSLMIAICMLSGMFFSLSGRSSKAGGARLLMIYVLIAIGVIGAVPTQYHETRYSFFLYPLLICISGYAVYEISQRLRTWHQSMVTWVPITFVGFFLFSSDFAVEHLVNIKNYDANFRVGYSDTRTRHYYPRMDFRSPADYVNEYATSSDLILISSVVYSEYLDHPDVMYLNKEDGRYKGQECSNGALERWTNLPLVGSISELRAITEVDKPQKAWLLIDQQTADSDKWQDLLRQHVGYREVYESPDRQSFVYVYASM